MRKTQYAIVLLLLALVVILWLRIADAERLGRESLAMVVRDKARDQEAFFDRLLELKGSSLAMMAFDYTFWGEMVSFMASGDRRWAVHNLDTALATYQASALWVFDLQWRPFYSAGSFSPLPPVPLPDGASQRRRLLGERRFCHFFADTAAGLMEVRGATIHPDDDRDRRTPPHGYLFVARLWDGALLRDLSQLTDGEVSVRAAAVPAIPASNPPGIVFSRTLPDWQGRPLKHLAYRGRTPLTGEFARMLKRQSLSVVFFSVLLLMLIAFVLLRWVYHPLRRISLSLRDNDEKPLLPLINQRSEFGHIAILLAHSFQQKARLQAEFAERVRIDAELEKARQEAVAALRAKSAFVATMSHEIRTPLNAIIGFGELLQGTPLDPAQQDFVNTISESSQALLGLVDDVLSKAKLEIGKVTLERMDFDLGLLVQNAVRIVKPRLGNKPVAISVDGEEELAPFYNGDPTRLRQILLNLLSNAAKFTENGEISVTLRPLPAESGDGKDECRLEITVQDTGIGIDPAMHDRIFEPFTQADMSTTRKYGGTGLGLSISRQLAELMKGTIRLHSRPGSGSTFVLTICLHRAAGDGARDIRPLRSADLQGRRALLVDGDDGTRNHLAALLAGIGLQVSGHFARGDEALAWLATQSPPPDLAICDTRLPDMEGTEFAQRLRRDERLRPLKLLALSGDTRPGAARDAAAGSFDAFLPKPVSRHDLQLVAQTVLGDQRAGGPIITRHLSAEISLHGRRVMVAEDNPVNRKLMQKLLEKFGCTAIMAENGREAVDRALAAEPPDLVLMDLQMPVMGGVEATVELRRRGFSAPVLALTAASGGEEAGPCRQAGMNDVLTKPIRPERLRETLAHWLG